MDLGVCGLDSTGSGQRPVAGCCECGDEPSGSCATELVNVRSLYRTGSFKTVARELGKYELELVGVQEVRWEKGGTERAEDYTFFYGAFELGTGFFVHKRIISAVTRVEFFTDRLCYIILRSLWYNIVFLNVCAPCEESDNVKDSF
jgi:hypothetical protein